ncbi:MAG: PQQ-dependent sugar dehydrogenase, partial [Verrucomicrobiota bacterium]|nr:PQQ-dependent sugar dehydrogenase [Verrucomicrobiota bacterium]
MTKSHRLLAPFVAAALCTQSHAQLPSIGTGTISVELQTIATGLNSPVELVSANDGTGRLFVVEQGGRIKILNSGAVVTTPFLDVSARIVAGGERGLLGLAFHPGFNQPASPGYRRLYTYTSEPVTGAADFSDNSASDHQSVITEWQVSATNPDVVDPASRREVMRIDQPQSNHNGGKIAFRPSDGYLYIALGDGGASNDVGTGHTPNLGNAQDVNNVLGDILRIDPLDPASTLARSDPPSLNAKYRVPATNPFIGAIVGVDEIFAYGFRNPYRFSFDPVTDQLIVGDVGQGAIEEVDIVEPGKNYGWNRKEGSFLFNPSNGSVSPDQSPNPAYVNPVLEYDHDDGISVIGGFVYRGSAVPALSGKYVFGDFLRRSTGNGRLFYGDFDKRVIQELRIGINPRSFSGNIKGIGIDSSDELYVVGDGNSGGQVLKVVPIPASPALVNLSTRARIETGENVLIAGFILTG